jgi:hypothetical protein
MDAVALSLYKRVWPRPARHFVPGMELQATVVEGDEEEEDVPELMEGRMEE